MQGGLAAPAHALQRDECASLRRGRGLPPKPREAGLSGAAGRDVLSNFAGHGTACPGFMKTRYSASALSTTTARTTERDPQVARCGAGRIRAERRLVAPKRGRGSVAPDATARTRRGRKAGLARRRSAGRTGRRCDDARDWRNSGPVHHGMTALLFDLRTSSAVADWSSHRRCDACSCWLSAPGGEKAVAQRFCNVWWPEQRSRMLEVAAGTVAIWS